MVFILQMWSYVCKQRFYAIKVDIMLHYYVLKKICQPSKKKKNVKYAIKVFLEQIK
jgi:hypothetical protein